MFFKTLFALILIIVRLLVSVKVISWIILNIFTNIPHPISEIEVYLVIILLDIWLLSTSTEIVIKEK
jgi:hypothetical protein